MNRILFSRRILVLAAFILIGLSSANFSRAAKPVILDTDIGTDIDDSWALALLLRSPEVSVKLVVTETGDTEYRAKVAAKFLERVAQASVPVGIGVNEGPMPEERKNLAPWISDYALDHYPGGVKRDGVQALIEVVMHATEPITIVAIGPCPNLAEALRREPRIAERCRLVGMFGSFDRGYDGAATPAAEFNVKDHPAALRATLAAPWQDILITPLDTCGIVQLSGKNYHAIWCNTSDPLDETLIESYCIFASRVQWMRCDYFTTRSTTLFDCVAAYLAFAEKLVDVETVRFDVTDDGFTQRSANGPYRARVALRWRDRAAFETFVSQRLSSSRP